MRGDEKFCALSLILVIVFIAMIIGFEVFNISMFTLGFIFFGIPMIVMVSVFWYDLIDSLLDL